MAERWSTARAAAVRAPRRALLQPAKLAALGQQVQPGLVQQPPRGDAVDDAEIPREPDPVRVGVYRAGGGVLRGDLVAGESIPSFC